ncbi:MAG TPA: UDP-2,4-diacetamido-2,4,6-trideoxy-beta-L-altropyranose hydrolase [Gemmatimonadaceae bacterium]|nr:UDP-2,4-diacetamido-2,4,6-trideoxy-beta-L-altropyranose hydrolase [Gemmatimonadaceae bacterium]
MRADSSADIGAGHISRCGALAEALFARGVRATLLTRELAGSVAQATDAMEVLALPPKLGDDRLCDCRAAEIARRWLEVDSESSWLVVDHYDLDATWERAARGDRTRVFAIDDLADRPHACDLLLDQNLSADGARRYSSRVRPDCRLLFGPRFALLRPAFAEAHASARVRQRVKRVLFFFGGGDVFDLTTEAIKAIGLLGPTDAQFDVVVGGGNSRAGAIRALVSGMPSVTFHFQTDRMAELMAAADISVGAGGTATWERCCVGLPALVIVTAENQRRVVKEASEHGACRDLGYARDVTSSTIAAALEDALSGDLDLSGMSRAALSIVDGKGAARVAEIMLSA